MKRELENTEEGKIHKVESLLNQYGTELKRIAYLYVRDHSLTEDILQEVFISCFKQMDYFREESSYKTWLIKITINKCKDALKRWSFRNIIYKDNLDSSLVETRTPEIDTLSKLEDIQLAKHILALPIKFREVIILFYYQDLSIGEISLLLDLKNNTIKTRLHRARTKLKESLERGGLNG
ncbi:sigma-70 family RNA polymerase sigma factor [Paucisalibacillus sp. EB02]|uniref:sigma-70 family RNA polymerase sigma factor n=1 Tax=Paucisalibacillus sp. EB02 TaxID=1347087 RepID=UPI0004AC974E|nr:sigma-70 family RNA polymerase sigma factor [Paucisalibacillus sp. EB02]